MWLPVSKNRWNNGFYNLGAVLPIFSAALFRRVDWIDWSDSNEVQGGFGRNHGIQYALSNSGYQLYGTGLFSGNENAGPGSNMGYFCNASNDGSRANDNANIPAGLVGYNQYLPAGLSATQFATHYAWYMSDAQSNGNNTGWIITPGGPHDVNHNWRGYWRYGKPSTPGAGNFRPAIRRGDSPFTQLAIATEVITGGGDDTLATITLDLAAASRNYQLDFRWGPSAYTINGPVYLLWGHSEDLDKTFGWQVHVGQYRGGEGLIEFIKCAQASDPGMTEYFRVATESQTGDKMALVCICSGLNDRNDSAQTSLGPIGGLPCDTAAGFADNTRGIMDKCITNWVANGFARQNLYFLLWVSNPISNRDDPKLTAYRAVMELVCQQYQNCAAIDTNVILNSYLQCNAAAWYASGGSDTQHLTQTGYEQTSLLVIKSIFKKASGSGGGGTVGTSDSDFMAI